MEPSPYWDAYYAERRQLQSFLPSQFAAFVAGELRTDAEAVLDVGCGNGRDALFLAGLGYRVVGLDASREAVALCTERRDAMGAEVVGRAAFTVGGVADGGLEAALTEVDPAHRVAVYARFFLHAVPEEGEVALLRFARDLGPRLALMAVEFRTHRDALQPKATPEHFRRFIEPPTFLARAAAHGLVARYHVEGFGLAKHAADDAHVARVLLVPA